MYARLVLMLCVVASAPVSVTAVRAEETGLIGLHEKRREGGKLCFSDHEHSGSSSGQRTRKAAEIAAGIDWQGFTAFEYGSTWGSFANAAGKRFDCSQSASGWGCSVSARPCRR